jgi:hypothetical protein
MSWHVKIIESIANADPVLQKKLADVLANLSFNGNIRFVTLGDLL